MYVNNPLDPAGVQSLLDALSSGPLSNATNLAVARLTSAASLLVKDIANLGWSDMIVHDDGIEISIRARRVSAQ